MAQHEPTKSGTTSFPKEKIKVLLLENIHESAFEMFSESVSVSRMINDFYLSDAAARLATGTSLAASAKRLRNRIHVEVGERLAMYLCVAVGGEVRHFDALSSGLKWCNHLATHARTCG